MYESLRSQPLTETLNPRQTPEMGFQAFRLLNGEQGQRNQQRDAFIQGEVVNPVLDYPDLDEQVLKDKTARLYPVFAIANDIANPDIRSTVWDTASYRLADMYWAQSAENINRTWQRRSEQELQLMATRTQELNEQLYGTPEIGVAKAISAEIWAQIDERKLSDEMATLKLELEQGTTITVAGEQIFVPPFMRHESERLPQIPSELLTALREKAYADNPDIIAVVTNYWNDIVLKRREEDRAFMPQDVFTVFQQCHSLRDPEGTSGVAILYDPKATATSWDPSLQAVKIGGARAPITSPQSMLGIVIHEYGVHGARAISGATTDIPVLGTGMFTEADRGEMSDYVTFEEGFASMCQLAMENKREEWKPSNIEKYLAIVLAYEGRDFRQSYESLWRARVLVQAKNGENPTPDTLARAKRNAWASLVRVFRGTPTDMPRVSQDGTPRPLTYNKDLAYLNGKLQVMAFYDRYKDNADTLAYMLDLAFKAKFDPMNRRQLALVQSAFPRT